ncbi:hypothetical protein QVD17_05046 [Tagetes erecta]|uniref:Cation/H+ exchanger domain-containing protein n=1 Tax=Tagetes erecta TaxID=13708 RepID=A0AAD8P525_TARER|nr:hypothetical protein QVD17_05046 [Tagetes erecta]
MDEAFCDIVNPAISLTAQVSSIIVLSHVFQILLKPLGQHAPVAQILAGLLLGPSGLSRSPRIHSFFFENFVVDFYASLTLFCRICIMFLIGLEIDASYMMHNLDTISIIVSGGCAICTFFALAITFFVYDQTASQGSHIMLALVLIVILANTACPIVFRLVADLKFTTTDNGRLAICCSLIADMYGMFILIIITAARHKGTFLYWLLKALCCLLILVGVVIFTKHLANWLNQQSRNRKDLRPLEVMLICAVIISTAMTLETMGFSSIIACFIMGLMFPRRGKSARTMLATVTYMVYNFIFPIYFGFTGFRTNIAYLNNLRNIGIVLMIILLSIGGKISGTLAACHYLKRPLNDGVLLAFLFNMKGHVDILTLTSSMVNNAITSILFYNLMLIAVVISSLISSILVSLMVKRDGETLGIKHISMEHHSPKKELILLACVHSPHTVATMVGLIEALRGSEKVPIAPYLMHLIELPEKENDNPTNDHDHDQEDELTDEEDYGADDVLEINESIDIFTAETKMTIHQIKNVSPSLRMFQDVCNYAEYIRSSIIIIPFHKHQRIDGKLENDKHGIRKMNQKVLHHAPCSVAILIDRGHTARASPISGSECLQQVATLFFGGPDDREALGLSKRLSTHHHTNMTVIRFLSTSGKDVSFAHQADDVEVAALNTGPEVDGEDSDALKDFYQSYVTCGKARFLEKYTDNGEQTATILRDMAEMYSMFIVGKGGGRVDSALTSGMSDWEECPELGAVGDFLASSEFNISGSVLVVQQHVPTLSEPDDNRCV